MDWAGVELTFLSPSDKPDSLGRLGSYEVQEVIGRGGMGIVLRAFDEKLHRVVAIKVMTAPLATNATARRRFTREARSAAAVSHDHVVTIHGVEETSDLPYLVMQYVSGVSLQERLDKSGPLQLHEILRIGMQAATGLAAAHAQGLVHRDIKPANILLENGVERVKITDFGLAHAVDDVRTTQPGTVIGTPEYMSPEQARGEKVDHRSRSVQPGLRAVCDVRRPAAVPRRKHRGHHPPRLRRYAAAAGGDQPGDPGVAGRSHRQADCQGRQRAIPVGCRSGRTTRPVSGSRAATGRKSPAGRNHKTTADCSRRTSANARRRWSIAAAAVLLLCAGLSLAETTGVTNVAATVIRIVRGDGTLVVEVDDPNIQVLVDGEELVITGAGPKELRLRPGQHELQTVKDGKPVDTKLITITRDGREVVKVRREEHSALATGAPPTTSAPLSAATRLVWDKAPYKSGAISPDGRFIVVTDWESGDLTVRDLGTGTTRRLTGEGYPKLAQYPVISPDGKQVAYWWLNDKAFDLKISELDGSGSRVLYTDDGNNNGDATPHAWLPDGKQILATITNRTTAKLVLISTTDASMRVLDSDEKWRSFWEVTLSPDGRYVAYTQRVPDSRQRDIYLLPVDGGEETALVEHAADDHMLGWTPDGGRLVFASNRTGVMGIWIIALANGKAQGPPTLIKSDVGDIAGLGITRDGTLFYGVAFGGNNVYSAPIEPMTGKLLSSPVDAVQHNVGFNYSPDWSPDGKNIACLSNRGPGSSFIIRSLETNQVRVLRPTELVGFNFTSLRWSPDGKYLLVGSPGHRVDVERGVASEIVPGKAGRIQFRPMFTPDGKSVIHQLISTPKSIIRYDFDSGRNAVIYRQNDRIQSLTLSPDGQHLAFGDGNSIKLMPAVGGDARELLRLEHSITAVAWMPDGKHLLYCLSISATKGTKPATGQLWRVPTSGNEPENLAGNLPVIEHLRVHPDGRQIAFHAKNDQTDKNEMWALENFLPPLTEPTNPSRPEE